MALSIHEGLLHGLIKNMYDEGILNDQFMQLQFVKRANHPDFVVRAITNYCISAQNLFTVLTSLIEQENVDFHQVNVSALELFEKSSSVGAEHVKLSCGDLIHASADLNKEHCAKTLYWTKNEFTHLKRKFETLVQMERKIIELRSGQGKEAATSR